MMELQFFFFYSIYFLKWCRQITMHSVKNYILLLIKKSYGSWNAPIKRKKGLVLEALKMRVHKGLMVIRGGGGIKNVYFVNQQLCGHEHIYNSYLRIQCAQEKAPL